MKSLSGNFYNLLYSMDNDFLIFDSVGKFQWIVITCRSFLPALLLLPNFLSSFHFLEIVGGKIFIGKLVYNYNFRKKLFQTIISWFFLNFFFALKFSNLKPKGSNFLQDFFGVFLEVIWDFPQQLFDTFWDSLKSH